MAESLPAPKKDGDVTVYKVEVTEDELNEPIQVPMQDKNTRLVVRLVQPPVYFST
jgi:hypothetical protein